MEPAQTAPPAGSFAFAHLSDPHLTSAREVPWSQLLNKRGLGYLSQGSEGKGCQTALRALTADLSAGHPQHIAVTGDLTNLGTGVEYRQAADWLASLGAPETLSVVPGNHDCYAPALWAETLAQWRPWLASDDGGDGGFPTVRCRGPVAFIGVSSAVPTAVGLATGWLGRGQRERLAEALRWTAAAGYCRVLLIHHPPQPYAVAWRKRLTDAPEVRAVLASLGAELVLHGHAHRFILDGIEGPGGAIPVLGAPSASASAATPAYRAGYYRCRVDTTAQSWVWGIEARSLAPAGKGWQRLDAFSGRLYAGGPGRAAV
jgi:3',5'-cyclic AMP phosphodiesterase CpdA